MKKPISPTNSFASPNSAFESCNGKKSSDNSLPPIKSTEQYNKDMIRRKKNAFKYIKNLFCPPPQTHQL